MITTLTTTQFEYGLSFRRNQNNQGHHINKILGDKAPRRFKRFYEEEGEFDILTLANWFSHYSYSRTSICSSMGGWLGKYSMLSKVLRSKKKEKEKNRKMKKRRKEKKKMKEKKGEE